MLITLKDPGGKVIAYSEYGVVDNRGKDAEDGEYCFVRESWIHEDYRDKGLLQKMVLMGGEQHPQLKWIYFEREGNEKLRIYDIWRLIRDGFKTK